MFRLEPSGYTVCAQSRSAKRRLPNGLFSTLFEKQGKFCRLLALWCFWSLILAGRYHALGHRTCPGCVLRVPRHGHHTRAPSSSNGVLEKPQGMGKYLSLTAAFLGCSGKESVSSAWNWALGGQAAWKQQN